VRKATEHPDVAQRITAMGFDVQKSSPALFTAAMNKERPVWERLIKASGAKLD
jgi:tripartite-type tricarboxylate transporter receptor subunit TctC